MLHIKYRPSSLEEVIGNEGTVASLNAILMRPPKDRPRAFLFSGPSGCGKTTFARIASDMIGCSPTDFKEVDSAQYRGIDSVRELRQMMMLAPRNGDFRVFLLDEVHQLSKDAQSGLLKVLEDTPTHVVIMLATTDPEKLLPTIRNRCHSFTVQPLTEKQTIALMRSILKVEKSTTSDKVLEQIANDAMGSARAALVMLDKVRGLDEKTALKLAKAEAVKLNETIELCRMLMKKTDWKEVAAWLKTTQQDPEQIRRAVLGYCSNALLGGSCQAWVVLDAFRTPYYDNGKSGLIMSCWEVLKG